MFHSAVSCSAVIGVVLLAQISTIAGAKAQMPSGSGTSAGSASFGLNTPAKGALGLVINYNQQGQLLITNIVPGGPAALSDVAVGDELLAVGDTAVKTLSSEQVLQRLLGAPGTSISLSLQSQSRGNYQVNLTRVSAESLEKSSNFKVGWQDNSTTGSSPTINVSEKSKTNISGSAGWNTYGGQEQGFTVNYPQGWSINQEGKTGKIEISNSGGSKLSIFPFFLPEQSFNVNQAQGFFQAMLKQYAPGSNWSAPAIVGGGLRATSTSDNINSIAGLALSGMRGGTNGRLIIIQVSNNSQTANELMTLSQILQSFTITGVPAQDSGGDTTATGENNNASGVASIPNNIQFTKFNDPNFGAFSLDVPVGWNVTGGMKKPMPIDLRPWVKAVSPDDKIVIFIGDGSIEPRYLPASWLTFLGCPPGSTYKQATGLVSKVLYYEKADKFIQNYAKSRFGKACDSFELVNIEHHPDLAREINGEAGVVASDAASVQYNFTAKGNPGVAYFLAATKKGQAMWWVSQICGVVAARGCEQQALDVFLKMYKSWQYNPQWSQAQGAANIQHTQNWMAADRAARARSAAAFSSRMAAMDARHNSFMNRMRDMDASHARYMNNMRSSDRAHSDFINYIRDEDTLTNPATGTKYQVEYGPKYHWVNSTGDAVVGTDSAWSPGVNWTELVTPPRP